MQAYRLLCGAGIAGLERFDAPTPQPGPHDVLVRIRAVSLNYRDLMFAHGNYAVVSDRPVIPLTDGAGEVIAVGDRVTRFKPGDRVVNTYFPHWIDGDPTPEKIAVTLGAHTDGVLAEFFLTDERVLATIPAHLDYTEAATLACAGITAWNALFADGGLQPGASVLLLGTGGVSIWALQIAKAAGLRAIVTSSSDAKLERARALGADATINYRTNPEWQDEVRRLTAGRGVDLVVEVGGEGTLPRSLAAVRMGGTVSVIGGVSGFGDVEIGPIGLITGVQHLSGIHVGSRTMLQDLNCLVEAAHIHPVIDRVFDFEQAAQAYAHLEAGQHFGKVVIHVS
ncbi:zinc-dependent alcohol dehydrogenase family protein [Scleromatobacter humisilvae]|uniref:NAD(P)-dependent alcohol dehydrogenase n=1 Tax=Scleromatobacter humisilvae TaxID=2897159 RepID=A0A9X1YH72_9BURK|nr:NAD(P)-dependent alcohol dehydrogenase [Scleromatobacter humisilvae]MCK9685365.1 NAD(P)-dependent alcohol dehydrogenase [Scleromatobacter humisilvae]